jgi:hypothetical protein
MANQYLKSFAKSRLTQKSITWQLPVFTYQNVPANRGGFGVAFTPDRLLPFIGGEHQDKTTGLHFSLPDYLELTDWAGQAIREDKSGAIPTELARSPGAFEYRPGGLVGLRKELQQKLQHSHWSEGRDKVVHPNLR